ncbi:MAG: methyltransferase domain-containing protein [Candidatus Lokiarchaeota archaeon]|nr:methyltransferase domain-containing protein [Candidatus Lokiarchaeota archaeon]
MKKEDFYSFNSQLSLPFLESDESVFDKIFLVLKERFNLRGGSEQMFIDLGAGNGRIVIHCALNYNIISKGIEINPHLIEEANERIEKLKKQQNYTPERYLKIEMEHGDLFETNLAKYDFIYIFSLPTMQKYLNHIFRTAKSGAIIISYKYPLEEFEYLREAHQIRIPKTENDINIYFYRKIENSIPDSVGFKSL